MAFMEGCPHVRGGLYEEILSSRAGWPYPQGLICTERVHLGLSKVAFIEGCPHIRYGLYEEILSSIEGWPYPSG